MQRFIRIIGATIAGLSLVATIISGGSTQAQTNSTIAEREDQPILDGSRYLREIEPEETFDFNFTPEAENATQTDEDYQLEAQDSDLDLEEKDAKWGNRGDVEDPSVQVDVHEF